MCPFLDRHGAWHRPKSGWGSSGGNYLVLARAFYSLPNCQEHAKSGEVWRQDMLSECIVCLVQTVIGGCCTSSGRVGQTVVCEVLHDAGLILGLEAGN
jgi:hypothetical protein